MSDRHQSSGAALTIYECQEHGVVMDCAVLGERFCPEGACAFVPRPVRVFREEHVRPLWESADGDHDRDLIHDAADAFPAPDEWKAKTDGR